MNPLTWLFGIVAGLAAGVMSGAFGVGGGIVTTPVIRLMGGTPIQAVATSLPVIIPTALSGAYAYRKKGEISLPAATCAMGPGAIGAIVGALLTELIDAHVLLLTTAVVLAWQAVRIARGRGVAVREHGDAAGWQYALAGSATGIISGLLGVGGGVIFVPIATTMLGMPLKRALGTSLVLISVIALPGTVVHAMLGNVNWLIALALVLGVVPGARVGARLALRAKDRNLQLAVAAFLFVIAVGYGSWEAAQLVHGR